MGESARKGEGRTLGKATREGTEKPIGKKRGAGERECNRDEALCVQIQSF